MGETVNHPDHYTAGGIEVLTVIHRYGLDFDLGNAVKYLLRADFKGNRLDDLRKARFYIASWAERFGNDEVEEPCADEGTLVWADPDRIADAKGLTGDVREAALAVLEVAVFTYDDFTATDQMLLALLSLDAEIARMSANASGASAGCGSAPEGAKQESESA